MSQHLRWRISWVLIVPLIALTFASRSRSAYIFCAWVVIWLLLWKHCVRQGEMPQRRKRPALWLPIVLLCSALLIQGCMQLVGVSNGAERIVSSGARVDSIRQAHLKAAWAIFREHPLTGAGFGTFRDLYPQHLMPKGMVLEDGITPRKPEHSHNLFAELAVDFGVLGIATFALWWWFWLRQLDLKSGSPSSWMSVGLLGILWLHSMLEYPLWYAQFLGVGAIGMSLGHAPERVNGMVGGLGGRMGGAARSFLLVAVTALVFIVGLVYVTYARYASVNHPGV